MNLTFTSTLTLSVVDIPLVLSERRPFECGAFDAYNQWEADELRPDLTQGQRQARAVVTGATTAVGGWGGTLGGAKLGAAVGVAVGGPVGAAVGGIVGGIIGGVAGSWLGGKAADGFKGIVGGN